MIKATIQRSPYVTEMTFPCSETQLSKWLDELRMNPEHLCPAAMVVQIEPMELSVLEECEVSLDALNYLAKRMDGMDARELNQFFAVLTCDELEIGWGLKNIINLTFNLERFTLIEDTSNLENVGMTHMFNIRGCISSSELENKEWLVDEGRKLLDSGKGIQTEYGLLFVNEDIEFSEVFNGTTFPGYYCDPDSTAAVEISYCNLTELVELPCEDITIKKALCGLGVGSIKDCKLDVDYTQNFSGEWREKISAVKHTKDIFGLNNMLKTEEIRMEQTESVFMNEVKRSLLNNGYDVAKNGDFLMVSLNGRTAAFVNDIRMINNSNDNSDDEYLKIKGVVRSVNEYCNAYEKSPLLKAEGLTGDYHCLSEFNGTVLAAKSTEYGFMNNNQLTEVAKILGVSEDSVSAMDDEIKNSMTAVFEQVAVKNDEDKKAVFEALDNLWQKGSIYIELSEVAKSTGITTETLRSLDYETQQTIVYEFMMDSSQTARFYDLVNKALAVADLPNVAKLIGTPVRALRSLPRRIQENICGAYAMEYDADSTNMELIDNIREMIAP